MLLVAYHHTMGATFWRWRREAVFVYVVIVLLYTAVSHHPITSTASELAERERSGNSKIFTVSLNPSGSLVLKVRLRMRPATA